MGALLDLLPIQFDWLDWVQVRLDMDCLDILMKYAHHINTQMSFIIAGRAFLTAREY